MIEWLGSVVSNCTGLTGFSLDVLVSFITTVVITLSVIIIGALINKLEQWQLRLMSDKVGMKIASFMCNRFTFVGTVIHELSHALFVMLTGGKILKIKCFEMFTHGRLGYVNFATCGPKWKQLVQMSLVSCAPVLMGIILEVVLLKVVFTYELQLWIQILLWYLVISIFDHMSMSTVDIKNYCKGLVLVFPMMMGLILFVKYFLMTPQ
ncbi:hypothetical protein J6A31_07380 [bacterium]|nr:hypothetical protein [bacterium]